MLVADGKAAEKRAKRGMDGKRIRMGLRRGRVKFFAVIVRKWERKEVKGPGKKRRDK